jgi:hypothetical protein
MQSPDGALTIQEGSEVRLKIMGVKMDQTDIVRRGFGWL